MSSLLKIITILAIISVLAAASSFLSNEVAVFGFEAGFSASSRQLRDPFQQKVYYYGGRAWISYNNGSHYVLTSTVDGSRYASDILISDRGFVGDYGEKCALFFDINSVYVHFVWLDTIGLDLWYRRGKPYADGSMIFDPSSLVHNGSSSSCYIMPVITVDSEGYPWIGACFCNSSGCIARVLKSDTRSGAWKTAFGFPHDCGNAMGRTNSVRGIPVRLSNRKMAVLHQEVNDYIYCDIWDGMKWCVLNEKSSSQESAHGDYVNAVGISDDIHMVYTTKDSPINCTYRARFWTAGWQENETTIISGLDTNIFGVALNWARSDDSLRVFWADAARNNICFKRRLSNGTWQGTVSWYHSSEPFTDSRTVKCSYETSFNDTTIVVCQVGASQPYHFLYKDCSNAGEGENPQWETDVNDDGIVDLKDVFAVVKAFGSEPDQPNWNEACDIDKNGRIGLKDYYYVCRDHGKIL